uniref:Large ribosomal subunit protein mL42 n=1 Tax=Strongyloides stercoralis TaxID=6248 RepID=A0A0K0DXC1_STRER
MFGNISSLIIRNKFITIRKLSSSTLRLNFESEAKKNQIVVTKSGTVLCWHPEQDFPFENSLPIEKNSSNSKSPLLEELREKYSLKVSSTKGPSNKVLQEMFYTNKNEWYTRTREDKLYQTSAKLPKRK